MSAPTSARTNGRRLKIARLGAHNALCLLLLLLLAAFAPTAHMQDPVTGAFEGTVTDATTQARLPGALVEIANQASGVILRRRTDEQGRFYQGLLPPGVYTISVTAAGYVTQAKEQRLYTSQPNQVVPIPFALVSAATATPSATGAT